MYTCSWTWLLDLLWCPLSVSCLRNKTRPAMAHFFIKATLKPLTIVQTYEQGTSEPAFIDELSAMASSLSPVGISHQGCWGANFRVYVLTSLIVSNTAVPQNNQNMPKPSKAPAHPKLLKLKPLENRENYFPPPSGTNSRPSCRWFRERAWNLPYKPEHLLLFQSGQLFCRQYLKRCEGILLFV